jgi:hypothetical protein
VSAPVDVLAVMDLADPHLPVDLADDLADARDAVMAMVAAAKELRFDLYTLDSPEMRAAFDGNDRIIVVHADTLLAFKSAVARVSPP